MKSISYIWVLLACLTLTSCYEDDLIVPEEFGGSGRFEFPQGDNSWDDDIAEIYNQFGVRLIYKGITDHDFTRSWLGIDGGIIAGNMTLHASDCVNDEMIQFYVTFMKEHIFNFVSPKIKDKVFPMYWYLAYNFHVKWVPLPGYEFFTPMYNKEDRNFMDFWITCLWGQNVNSGVDPLAAWISPTSGNKANYDVHRYKIMNDIMTVAMERGNIVPSDEFSSGLDFATFLDTGDSEASKQNPNYFLTRGFPGTVTIIGGTLTFQKTITPRPGLPNDVFLGYMQIMMAFNAAQREELFPAATYPLLKRKFDYVQRFMKERYDIDLEAIANGPANWDITPYPELPPATDPE